MKAIRSSSPFPPPPSELEIYVRFSNRDWEIFVISKFFRSNK
jgi:hypothetical protein